MTSTEREQVRRGVAMVGPSYLYNGSQVCGRRTSRTCIFLLAAFGIALNLIGIVFFTADLRMKSGLWAAGLTFILLGMVMLVWFLTLCCAARCAFKALPNSHPTRTMTAAPILVPPRSSTYQLLPMTPATVHDTPNPHVSTMRTLPISATQKTLRVTEPTGYQTWGHGGHKEYGVRQPDVHPPVYTWGTATRQPGSHLRPRDYFAQDPMEFQNATAPTAHILRGVTPTLQEGIYSTGFHMGLPATYASSTSAGDDNPPPYYSVVSGP